MKLLTWAALTAALSPLVSALGQERIISTDPKGSVFQLAGGRIKRGQILVSPNDYWGVIRAAGDLALDFGRVTGVNYTLSNGQRRSRPAVYTYRPVDNTDNVNVSQSTRGRVGEGRA